MKLTTVSIIIAFVLIGGVLVLGKNKNQNEYVFENNVSVVDGKQIIEIKANNGYHPEKSLAKAGIPTIIRFNGSGTFDCSSFVRIPEKNISQNLSQTGTTDIDLGVPSVGVMNGFCGMGMYPFEIEFQ